MTGKCHNQTDRLHNAVFARALPVRSDLFKMVALAALTLAVLVTLFWKVGGAYAVNLRDIPDYIRVASVNTDLQSVAAYPDLFGSDEKSSSQLRAFTKWSDMFARFDRQLSSDNLAPEIITLQARLRPLQGQSLDQMARAVNQIMNVRPYITDSRNWGKTDYWATPLEFLKRGGDCEDYAIAKYTALKMLGVPESRLRIAIVQDQIKNIPHAVLIVYTEQGTLVLDNQNKQALSGDAPGRYRPIFSINRQAWWLHTDPRATRMASAY